MGGGLVGAAGGCWMVNLLNCAAAGPFFFHYFLSRLLFSAITPITAIQWAGLDRTVEPPLNWV